MNTVKTAFSHGGGRRAVPTSSWRKNLRRNRSTPSSPKPLIKRWPTAGQNRRRGQQKVDVITNPETTAASPDMAIPFGSSSAAMPAMALTSRPATRNMSASTAPITAPRRSAVWATKATAANSRSARPSKARRGYLGSQRDVRPLERRS